MTGDDRDDPAPGSADLLDELVSAVLDGEATDDEVARVEADPTLRARRDELGRVAAAVASPVTPASAADRDRAIAAALAVADGVPAPSEDAEVVDLRTARDRRRRTYQVAGSVAAVVLAAVLAVPLLSSRDDDSRDAAFQEVGSATSGDAADTDDSALSELAPGAGSASAGERDGESLATDEATSDFGSSAILGADLGDLGDFPSTGALAASVATTVDRSTAGAASEAPATTTAPATTAVGPPAAGADATGCDVLAAAGDPAGAVVAIGTARAGGDPVVVLVVEPFDPTRPTQVLVTDPGCVTVIDQRPVDG